MQKAKKKQNTKPQTNNNPNKDDFEKQTKGTKTWISYFTFYAL